MVWQPMPLWIRTTGNQLDFDDIIQIGDNVCAQ